MRYLSIKALKSNTGYEQIFHMKMSTLALKAILMDCEIKVMFLMR